MLTRYKTDVTQKPRFFLGFVTSACALVALMLCTLFFSVNVSASTSTSASTDINVNIVPVISIRTLDKDANLDIASLDLALTPTPSGKFIKNTTKVDVSTTNPSGYNLYMSSSYVIPSSITTENPTGTYTEDMIHSDNEVADKVSNLASSNVAESIFSATSTSATPNPYIDNWGYSLTDYNVAGTYNPLPAHTNATLIRDDVVTPVDHSYTPVTIGANIDTNIASGTYSNKLVFSTIVNPPYVDYKLYFNANTDGQGGDDSTVTNMPSPNPIAERVMATSYTITIPGDSSTPTTLPQRPGYTFNSWNTKPDGTGTTYHPGDSYTLVIEDKPSMSVESAEGTLYAMWDELYTYTISYACSDGTCPEDYTTTTTDLSITYTIPDTIPQREGYNFKGYSTTEGGSIAYQPGDSVTISHDGNVTRLMSLNSTNNTNGINEGTPVNFTLYAIWAKLYTYSVSYNCNSGSGCPSNFSTTIEDTSYTYTIPDTAPTRTGHSFSNYSGSDSTSYNKGGTATLTAGTKESITLTANWTVNNYTVNISAGNITKSASSVAVPYGGSKTFTIKAASGYYINSFSCPTGYTCSGYSTGTSATAQYTVTVKNNSTTSGGTITITQTSAFFTISNMQQMTTSICNSATTPAKTATAADTSGNQGGNTAYYPQKTLKDTRNNTSYVVRKLADGNCWMSSNLKLNLTSGTAITAADFSGGTVSWTPNSNTTSSSGNAYNVAINANYQSNVNGGNWYYPWYAATAGQGTNTANPTINRSICPQGWRLPDGNTSAKSFYNLITTKYGLASSEAGANSLKAAPLSFVAAGHYDSGSLYSSSTGGYYWSATPNTSSANQAYYLNFGASGIYPQYRNYKSRGFSVRCVSI